MFFHTNPKEEGKFIIPRLSLGYKKKGRFSMTKAEQALRAVEEQRAKIRPHWNVGADEIQALYQRNRHDVYDFACAMFWLGFAKGTRFQKREMKRRKQVAK